jgi:hypothetical protein
MKRNSYYDSTDSESSSSEDEEQTTEDESRLRRGKIIKEGFLWEKLTMFPMSPGDHLLTNQKQSLIRSRQTPDPSVQFLVNM